MTTYKDLITSRYNRFLRRLIKEMRVEGFTLTQAFDGEEWFENDFLENATATDIGALRFIKDNDRITYTLIYGNAYYETISDYSWNSENAEKVADKVSTRVYDFFEKLSNIYH